jgi:hypothetical protein
VSTKCWSPALVAFALSLLPSPHARGQDDARAASLALFQEAEKLAASGDTAGACRRYGDSYSLDPQLEALLRWADCLEKEGKLASAHAAFQDAVALAQRASDPRWSSAEARAKQLRPRLSFITIEVAPERQLSTLSVERDGFRLGSSAWGVPIPIDPGRHTIRASAYGYREWQTTIDVGSDNAAPYVEVPMLERLPDVPAEGGTTPVPSAPPPPAPPEPVAPVLAPVLPAPASRPVPPDRASSRGLGPTRIAALALGGTGVVALGAGVYFLVQTRSMLSERDGICPSGVMCEPGTNQRLAELTNDARSSQRAEFICLGLGGAALGAGVALWLLPARKKPTSAPRATFLAPTVHPGGAGVLLQGGL